MNKRHFENCLSKEKRIYESNIKKYKKLMEKECKYSVKFPIKIEAVPIIPSEAVTCKSAGFVSNEVEWSQNVLSDSVHSDLNATQSVLQRSSCSFRDNYEPPKNTDILALLQQVLEGQNALTTRLEKIEETQTTLSKGLERIELNQTLSKGQGTPNSNHQQLANNLEAIEASAASKAEMMAQSKLLMECKVAIKRVQDSICRMTGETCDKVVDEVASMLPLRNIAAVNEVEEKLDSSDFAQAMNSYVHKLKGISEDVGSVIRAIFTDDLLEKYNWDGRCEKLPLANLMLFNKVIRNVFKKQGALEFEKSVKKAVERAHHRMKQKRYLNENKAQQK